MRRNALALKRKKVQSTFRELFGIIAFTCFSPTKSCLRFLLVCLARKIKGFYKSSVGNEVDFRNIMNVSPDILAKN